MEDSHISCGKDLVRKPGRAVSLGVAASSDIHTHAPIGRGRHQHWQRIHDPGRYPVLSDKDLVDLCFPTSQNQRRISRDLLPRAIRTLQSLEEAKELQIRGGKGRWQVLPPTPRTRAELE